MITCGESLGHLGKNEAKIWVVSDSVLSLDQQITFKATTSSDFFVY